MEKNIVLAVAGAGGSIGTAIFLLYHYNKYRSLIDRGTIPAQFTFWDYLRIIVFKRGDMYPKPPVYVTDPKIAKHIF